MNTISNYTIAEIRAFAKEKGYEVTFDVEKGNPYMWAIVGAAYSDCYVWTFKNNFKGQAVRFEIEDYN